MSKLLTKALRPILLPIIHEAMDERDKRMADAVGRQIVGIMKQPSPFGLGVRDGGTEVRY